MSAIGLGLPFGRILPTPEGVFAQEDFEHLAYLYRGIPAASPFPEATMIIFTAGQWRQAQMTQEALRQASPTVEVLIHGD